MAQESTTMNGKLKFLVTLSLAVLAVSVAFPGFSQKEVNMDSGPSFLDRVYTGGGFGFASNSTDTYLSVSPIVGYMITRKLSAGVGVTYQYYKNKIYKGEDHRYGGKIFVMQMLVYHFFLYGEYNFINLDLDPTPEGVNRDTWTRTLLGAGFSQPMGRASFNIIAAYDVSWNNSSPYSSPWYIGAFISI